MTHKLLLADDSVTIQRVIELTFADEDIRVMAVGDGKKAIASIQADRPDIVLADVGMPERDGYEVAAFIKTNPDLADIPVLLLTGAFEPIDEARARAVGCDGVLVKPFEPQMVINRVKDLLAGRRPAGLWSATPSSGARQPGVDDALSAGAPIQSPGTPAGSLEDYFDRLDAAFASMEGPPAMSPTVAPASSTMPGPPADFSPSLQAHRVPASPSSLPEGIAEWDPDLTKDPRKPAAPGTPAAASDPLHGYGPAPAQTAAPQPPAHTVPAPYVSRPEPPAAPPVAAAPVAAAPVPAGPPAAAPGTTPPPAVPAATVPPAAAPAASASPSAAPTAAALVASPLPTLAEAFASLLSAEQGRVLSPAAAAPPSDAAIEDIVQRVILRMGDQAVRATVTDVAERLVREEIQRIKSA